MNHLGQHIRNKQLGALGLCAFSVPAVLLLPQTGWAATGIVSAVSMVAVMVGRPVTGAAAATKGVKLLAIPLFVWNIGVIGKLAWELSRVYEVDSVVPGLVLLLLGAYAVKKGVVAEVGAVLLFFLLGIYGVMYLFAIPMIQFHRSVMASVRDPGNVAYGFLPILLLYMYKGEDRKGRLPWAVGGVVLGLGAAVITKGMEAPDFYTAAKSINLFGTMERWEPFVAVALTGGMFCLMAMLYEVDGIIWKDLWQQKKNFPIELITFVSAGMILVAGKVADRFWTLGTALCWGLVPILTQFVGHKKKD